MVVIPAFRAGTFRSFTCLGFLFISFITLLSLITFIFICYYIVSILLVWSVLIGLFRSIGIGL